MRGLLSAVLLIAATADAQTREVPNPSPPGSGQSFLIADAAGRIYLSWIEPDGSGGHRFQFAERQGESWRVRGPIAQGRNWFVNWADYPTFLPLPAGGMAAHWLEKFADSKYSYGLKLAQSGTHGSWQVAFAPKVQRPDDYNGFVSLVPLSQGLGAAYLAPGAKGGEEDKSLRFARLSKDGKLISDELLDSDVCTCCQTAAVVTEGGPVVAYRDHQEGEIRDISIVSLRNGKWTAPKSLHRDGWKINGCPVNGPALAATGKSVAAAWYTGAEGKPRVYAAFSSDSGQSFGSAAQVDDGSPIGRVAVASLPNGDAVVSWIERKSDGSAELRLRRISANGRRAPSQVVSAVDAARKTGFPKMVVSRSRLMLTWTADRVKTVEVELPGM